MNEPAIKPTPLQFLASNYFDIPSEADYLQNGHILYTYFISLKKKSLASVSKAFADGHCIKIARSSVSNLVKKYKGFHSINIDSNFRKFKTFCADKFTKFVAPSPTQESTSSSTTVSSSEVFDSSEIVFSSEVVVSSEPASSEPASSTVATIAPIKTPSPSTPPIKMSSGNSFCSKSHSCGELRAVDAGQKVALYGWVQHKRFDFMFTLRDSSGATQVVLPAEERHGKEMVQQLMDASLESVVKVTGFVRQRPDGLQNKKMSTGDIEVMASDFEILNPCQEALPFQVHDFQNVKESLRMQHRYLDLRNIKMQQNLRLRSKVGNDMRQFLCKHGFVEVETPTLFRKTPGGAREFIVPSQQKGKFYTLPQSPQQFKQLLMVGGIDRYFQFARCYRNEGARIDRQPEFTQVDIEMSFIEQNDILSLTEELIHNAWPEDKGQLQLPFPRMSYSEAINRYGSDKPDTRFGMLIQDVTSNFDETDLSFLSKDSDDFIFRAITIKEGMKHLSNRELKVLELEAKNRFDRNITVMKLTAENELKSPISKYLSKDVQRALCEKMDAETGDIIILGGGKTFVTCSLLGHLRKVVASLLERKGTQMRDPDAFNFVWVNNFPLFTPKEGGEVGLESTHHPFTAPIAEHMDLIHTNPGKVYGEHYDLVLNGFEIAGGSLRIHNEQLQRYVLEKVLKEDASSMDHLLQALQSGCPPHGGIAIGFDRFMAILCSESSIREVIAFPKTGEGNDLMCNAPTELHWDELSSYHIRLKDEES